MLPNENLHYVPVLNSAVIYQSLARNKYTTTFLDKVYLISRSQMRCLFQPVVGVVVSLITKHSENPQAGK